MGQGSRPGSLLLWPASTLRSPGWAEIGTGYAFVRDFWLDRPARYRPGCKLNSQRVGRRTTWGGDCPTAAV